MKLYHTEKDLFAEKDGTWYRLPGIELDDLYTHANPEDVLQHQLDPSNESAPVPDDRVRPPIQNQEVWAAGVTYTRSRSARMEESEEEEAKDFYDRVYDAERPELFFKATPNRTVGHGEDVAIRSDSNWSVPEPELAVAINREGTPFGYTVGNDMSARDIEGENPLYLPQAKVYSRCCALGPALRLKGGRPLVDGTVDMWIRRDGEVVFHGDTDLERLKRSVDELVSYLFRNNDFPRGCVLLTGTGIVPPDAFALEAGDEVEISIDTVGTLRNSVIVSD